MARILIVDDLLPNIKLLEVKLTKEYYDVVKAKSGQEALDILEKEKIDLVLLDVMMPGMDGFETCRKIKSNNKTSNIPVVMVTALSDIEDRVNGLKAGADDFVTKPIVDISLYARIRALVRLKNVMDELHAKGQLGLEISGLGKRESDLKNPILNSKILIINDDITESGYIENILTKDKFNIPNITIVDNPLINLEQHFVSDIDLIIVSTQLIKEDGLRVCAKIKNLEHMRDIPILIIVEEGDDTTLVKGLDMGINDYIVSPIDENEVIVRIATQIKRKKLQDLLKQHVQQNLSLATKDQLTGLYNRHYYDARYNQLYNEAIKDSTPLTLLIIDIDYFKKVNDTYGHLVGDEILKETAQRILLNIRSTDLAARFGGEEFVVLLPNTNINSAEIVAERIRNAIESTPFKISHEEGQLNKTVSIGIAILTGKDTMQDLLNRADKGLYIAKESGRNQVISIKK